MSKYLQSSSGELSIPDALKVPAGNELLLQAFGKGVQKYVCPDTVHAQPHAILLTGDEDEGDLVAIHFFGAPDSPPDAKPHPSWEAIDGSIVRVKTRH